jgi:hypothetical protein
LFQVLHKIRDQLLRRLRHNPSARLSSRRGQTALIMVLIIAIALIFYAASLNWTRVTQYKTLTIISSNVAASGLASLIASYGEQQLQVNLGGRPKYCERTNFMVMVVVIIIVIVITIITWGATSALLTVAIAAVIAVAAIAMAIAALIINLLVIQPGLVALWNKMQDSLMGMEDKILENGIMTGLQGVVTDTVEVQDHFDMDIDGLWVDDLGRSNIGSKPDMISRYAYFYTMRLKQLAPFKIDQVDRFMSSLNELIFDNPYNKVGPRVAGPPVSGCTQAQMTANAIECHPPDNFGLFDPGCFGTSPISPYCNHCCVPKQDAQGHNRPADCADFATTPNVDPVCLSGGAYPAPPYYYQYDPFYENKDNAFFSFREKLGVDDESMNYQKKVPPGDPNGLQDPMPAPMSFQKKDATGFYTAPTYTPPDPKKGVFPFFWDMGVFRPAAAIIFGAPVVVTPLAPIAGTAKTDNVAMVTYDPATGSNRFQAQDTMCSMNQWQIDVSTPKGFWWKPGIDHYCSTQYPYYDCVDRPGACVSGVFTDTVPNCGCTASPDPTAWREDPVDSMVDGLKRFVGWGQEIIKMYKDKASNMYNSFPTWYAGAAQWIAPKCDPAWNCDSDGGGLQPQCLYCNNQPIDGYLLIWRDQLGNWVDLLDKWLYGSSVAQPAPSSFADNASWCLPTNSASVPYIERKAIMAARPTVLPTNRNGTPIAPVWGDLDDTIACLNFNVNNQNKFTSCYNDCVIAPRPATAVTNCLDLPRSAVPGFDQSATDASVDVAYRNAQQLQNCLNSTCCTTTPCRGPLTDTLVPECQSLPGVTAPWNCVAFAPGNAFYNDVKTQRDAQFAASTVCTAAAVGTPVENFLYNVHASRDAAILQSPIFQSRSTALTQLRTETQNARSVFLQGYQKFKNFLRPCGGLASTANLGERCNDCKATPYNPAVQELQNCLDSPCSDGVGGVLPVCKGLPGIAIAPNCTNFSIGNPFYDAIVTQRNILAATSGGPIADLICARVDYTNHTNKLSNFAIYGWKDPDKGGLRRSGPNPNGGYWHIVRVEAFIPKRCYKRCLIDQFPEVHTYIKWEFEFYGPDQFQCYEMRRTEGLVIARVTRYDEDRTSPGAFFANTQRLWNFRFTNPTAIPGPSASTAGLEAACAPPAAWTDGTSTATKGLLENAFIINDNPTKDPTTFKDDTCWNKANDLLDLGVQTTTCAKYELDKTINHMSLKFRPCPASAVPSVFECAKRDGTGSACAGP